MRPVPRPTNALSALTRRGTALLLACGAFLIAEAILSHVRRVGWSGAYGWQRVAAILVAANPLTGHAVGRAIAIRRGAVWSDPADAASAPSGTQGASSSGDEQ